MNGRPEVPRATESLTTPGEADQSPPQWDHVVPLSRVGQADGTISKSANVPGAKTTTADESEEAGNRRLVRAPRACARCRGL